MYKHSTLHCCLTRWKFDMTMFLKLLFLFWRGLILRDSEPSYHLMYRPVGIPWHIKKRWIWLKSISTMDSNCFKIEQFHVMEELLVIGVRYIERVYFVRKCFWQLIHILRKKNLTFSLQVFECCSRCWAVLMIWSQDGKNRLWGERCYWRFSNCG